MLFKASIIGILIMLALNNINYKASIIGILIMVAFYMQHYKVYGRHKGVHSFLKKHSLFSLAPSMEYLYYDSINLEKVSCENAGALNKECSCGKNFIPFCYQINHFIHKIIAMIKFKYSEML